MSSFHESGPVAWWAVRRAPRRRHIPSRIGASLGDWPPLSVVIPDQAGWATVTGPLARLFATYPFLDLRRQLKRIGVAHDAAAAMEAALARGRTVVVATPSTLATDRMAMTGEP